MAWCTLKKTSEKNKKIKRIFINLQGKKKTIKIANQSSKRRRKMLPETQCNDALVVKGATDFSIAAIMGRQSVCMDSPDKSSSKSVSNM